MRIANLQTKPMPIALIANAVALTLGIILGGWRYVSMDDYFMHSVLTGAYGGKYDIHLYFVNAVYGVFLWPFYKFFPNVGWYPLFEKFAVFAAFVAITYVILRRFGNKLGGALVFFVISCIALDFYLYVEFTRCAAAATAAGILLFAFGNNERKRSYLIWGVFFLAVGFVFRKEIFLLGMPTLVAILFFSAIINKTIWKVSIVSIAVLAAVVFGMKTFDNSLYTNNDYEYYAAYQGPRAFFGDGDFYDFRDFIDELEERGLGSRDARYLQAWYFYDKDVFSIDSLKGLIEVAQRNAYKPNYLKFPFAVTRCISNVLMKGSVWCWLVLCLAIVFFSNKKCWWLPWMSLATVALSYTYLLLVNRVVDHVESGIWIFACIFALSFFNKGDIIESKQGKGFLKILVFTGLIGLVCTVTLFELGKAYKISRAKYSGTTDWPSFLQYANENKDDVFLLPFGRYKELGAFLGKTYKAIPPDSWDNIHSTGYWNIHLPPMDKELEKRGVTNLFKDVKRDNVFVLSDYQSLSLAPFYRDHYHEELKIDTVGQFGDVFLLKYREKETGNEQEIP